MLKEVFTLLTERQILVLKAIVEEFIQTAQPVGSRILSKKEELNFSAATIRNDMADLEDLGFIEKTHTSSGRVPSQKGYRYYVDNLLKPRKINGEDMLNLQIILHNQSLELSDCISKSLQLVSDMTSYTAVVLGKASHDLTTRSFLPAWDRGWPSSPLPFRCGYGSHGRPWR